MISVSVDTSSALAYIGKVQRQAYRNTRAAVVREGEIVERDWKANATQTAGTHGRHYPDSIEGRSIGALAYEIRPNAGMAQGAMSFEYGSRNQPPHLDGTRAFEGRREPILRAIRRAVESAL